jgi:hypothetical protein
VTLDVFRRYGNLLRPDGTNQLQRLLPALESDYVVPDERDFSALVEYARRVAAEVRYYDLSGQATGDWQVLLESLVSPVTGDVLPTRDLERLLASRADWPPHLVLFLVFLKIFRHLQTDLNLLTERHVRFYCEQVLGLRTRTSVADDVHIVFELAKNAAATLLPAGTLLDAGKDANGRPLAYATQTEAFVSAATIGDVKRVVVERDRRGYRRFFTAGGFSDLEGIGYTFGARQLDLDPSQRFMTEVDLGFAISAPILNLAEGERRVTLLAHLRAPAGAPPLLAQDISYAVNVALTGTGGWLVPDSFEANLLEDGGEGKPALSITLLLGSTAESVVPFDRALHGDGTGTRPLLRCLMRSETGIHEQLDGFAVEKIALAVDVEGVRNLVVQNEDGPLNATKPMPLFGSQPRIGAPFYIGSTEVFSKKLNSLDLHLEWKSPPPDPYEHYRAYFDAAPSDVNDTLYNRFQTEVQLLYENKFWRLFGEETLFRPTTSEIKTIFVEEAALQNVQSVRPYEAQPDLEVGDEYELGSKSGFLRLVLSGPTRGQMSGLASVIPFEAFGHGSFAPRLSRQAVALSQWDGSPPQPPMPNEPYTPTLSSLTLDYGATAELVPGDAHAAESFLLMGPFGAVRASQRVDARLVPRVDGEAALLLGVADLQSPANLSLLFQIEAGTATATEILQPGDVTWSCLAVEDVWQPLVSGSVLGDSTQGFQKAGIVALAIPREATLDHQSLPSGMLWLQARIDRAPESAARTLAIRPHATLARFQPGNLPLSDFEQHLQAGLPAGTISRLVRRNASIKRVEQPSRSFDGRGAEVGSEYLRRCSERLRHRNRAATAWDIERLVLEAFPEVFKAKCLPHTDASGARKPGHTTVVIVPNLRRTGATNVLEPRAGEVLLGQIEEYLVDRMPSFATLHVVRPAFERIRVEAKVVFMKGRDPGYYTSVLNEDLRRFLSPWAYQEGEDILFGARIYRSEILAFLEGREYVDHLTDLRVYHSFDGQLNGGIGWMTIGFDFIIRPNPHPAISEMAIGDDFIVGYGVEVAETTQAHAILVSHPEHLITAVLPGMETCPGVTQLGIGYMTIGLDFDVDPEVSA